MYQRRDPWDKTSTYMVEQYWPGVTEADFVAAARSVVAAAESLTAKGRPIRYLHSTLVPQDEVVLCTFEAASRSLVEEAYALAGVRFERIVDAVEQAVPSPRESITDRQSQGAKE